MKILAIRGKNLASLSTEFVVDFQSEPLASAGLFAITGPTGSGKSTLLDALCLALYERTPRLTGITRSGDIPDVGDNGITPGDVRTILRRGAGEGFAEVDFVGGDGIAYRSRWTARRARGKTDGKMQNSEISLTRIADEQVLGDHRKTETLPLIESLIGLSFEQFTRAVLLAQNDFSAFLKASDDDRAELLQTLTGTEMFSAISVQAYERMKVEKEQLLRLQQQLKDQEPLPTEARAEKDIQFQGKSDEIESSTQRQSLLEGHLRWYQQWDQLNVAEAEATQQLGTATTEKIGATSRSEQLALLDRVQSARPLWDGQVRMHRAVKEAEDAMALAMSAQAKAQEEEVVHHAAYDEALREQNLAEAAKTQAQPDVDSARELDASIVAIAPQFETAEKAQMDANERQRTEHSRLEEVQDRRNVANSDLATATQWLANNEKSRPLAEGWQRWEALFTQAQERIEGQSKANGQVAQLEKESKETENSVNNAAVVFGGATVALEADSAHLQALVLECATIDVQKLSGERLALEQDREQLLSVTLLWKSICDTEKLQQKQIELRQKQTDIQTKCNTDLLNALPMQPLRERELYAAEEALNLATLAASESADSLRASLQSEKPCPVCGSHEHPYADGTPMTGAVLTSLKDLVKTKRKALSELESSIATASAGRAAADLSIQQILLELTQLEIELLGLRSNWSALALHPQLCEIPESDLALWLDERQKGVLLGIEHLTQQESQYREAVKRKDAAQQKVNSSNHAVAQAKDALSSLTIKLKSTAQSLGTARLNHSEIAQQLLDLEGQLDAAFVDPAWRGQWRDEPIDFVAQCNARACAWIQNQTSVTTLNSKMNALNVEFRACESACLQATEQLKTQTQARVDVESILENYHSSRSVLFEGRPLTDVEATLFAGVNRTRSVVVAAQTMLNQAQSAVTRTVETVRQAELLLLQHRTASTEAVSNLEVWLSHFNAQCRDPAVTLPLGLEALSSLLQVAPEWIVGERERLQQIENTVTTAQAVLDTRRSSRVSHEAEKTDTEGRDELQENLTQLSTAIASASELLSALKLEIAKDDERLLLSQTLRVTIDKQAAASKVWAQLSELIGSADGKKFRNFSQQITLDILLQYGNQHLQGLTRRYRLQRIKDSLGLLVVDQDMGDEVRSVYSLSGGESFLVSLALALGLASLSSHRVRVESLFIDEGFGSLDADSLGIAMDALDNLQSLGRKVGVISHVQEMTDRIGTRVQVQRQSGGLSRILVS